MRTLLTLINITAGLLVTGAAMAYTSTPPPIEINIGDYVSDSVRASAEQAGYKPTKWVSLIPKGWDPAKAFNRINLDTMSDGDPRAMKALRNMRKAWEDAPVEPSLDGARIRIAGFVVPLETRGDEVTELLLVPYFGACIHVPPPPANQIIHVFPVKPIKNLKIMAAVWVSGVMETVRAEARTGTNLGMGFANAGYRMKAEFIEAYKEP